MRSPVRGFLPSRAGRSFLANLPKPATATSSPLASASAMEANTAPTAASAACLADPGLARDALHDVPLVHGFPFPIMEPTAARAPGCPAAIRTPPLLEPAADP